MESSSNNKLKQMGHRSSGEARSNSEAQVEHKTSEFGANNIWQCKHLVGYAR